MALNKKMILNLNTSHISMKFYLGFIWFLAYSAIVTIVYYIHSQYFRVNVVFYSALFDAAIAVVILSFLLFKLSIFRVFDVFEKVLITIIGIHLGYILAISIPTIIDRSLSFYILEKIQKEGGEINIDKFETIFTHDYLIEHHLMDVRLTEQVISGTINITNGCVSLTPKGNIIANASQSFRSNFLPKRRLLRNEYTSVLTNLNSRKKIGAHYSCE